MALLTATAPAGTAAAAAGTATSPSDWQCAVCWDDVEERAIMPCCGGLPRTFARFSLQCQGCRVGAHPRGHRPGDRVGVSAQPCSHRLTYLCRPVPTCTARAGRAESTTAFCQRCLEVVCEQARPHPGRCPNCRAFIRLENGAVVTTKLCGSCRMCRQPDMDLVDNFVCEACYFGSRHAYAYICDSCHRTQLIPHPMW